MLTPASNPPQPGPHGVPVAEFTQALARWSAHHPYADPDQMSDTALVPVRVDTTELSIRPGLLRELAILLDRHTETWENGGDGSVVPTDPSEFDSYLGLDGVIYHGFGEPDIEATAEAAAEDGPDDEGLH